MLTGDPGSSRRALEKITTALDLFDHLRTRCLLSRDNILFLQAMLYHARRIDLLNKLLEYGRTRGNTLHCYPEHDIGKSTNEHKGKLKKATKNGRFRHNSNIGHKTQNKTNKTKTQHRKIRR
jgi:hypothetical protein